jgi:hypothetical protein
MNEIISCGTNCDRQGKLGTSQTLLFNLFIVCNHGFQV